MEQNLVKELCAAIEINAAPERVWQILADTEKFPEWNALKGRAENGA